MTNRIIQNILFLVFVPFLMEGQCITNVDFNTWFQGGVPSNGNWSIQNSGSQIFQSINGEATFYLTPFDLINVEIEGSISVNNLDDDYIGFVFGLQSPLNLPPYDDYDMWLFDWKKAFQIVGTTTCGYAINSFEGFALSKVDGIIPSSSCLMEESFLGHIPNSTLNVIATDYGVGKGWTNNFTHNVKLIYT